MARVIKPLSAFQEESDQTPIDFVAFFGWIRHSFPETILTGARIDGEMSKKTNKLALHIGGASSTLKGDSQGTASRFAASWMSRRSPTANHISS
jgi:hypothetical protein